MSDIRKLEWALVAIGFAFLAASAFFPSKMLLGFLGLAGFTAAISLAIQRKAPHE